MKPEHKVALVAIVAIALIVGYFYGAFASVGLPAPATVGQQNPGGGNQNPGGGNQNPGGTQYADSVGTFTMKDNAYNALSISAALSLGSAVDQFWYANRNGQWILLGPHTATTGTNVEVVAQDGGAVYVVCMTHTTSTYIFAAAKTMSMNSRALSSQFVDVTGDGVKEFAVKLDMTRIPLPASDFPSITFNGFYFDEDAASATISSPTDVTAGATLVTSSVEWAESLSAQSHCLAWYKVQVKMNTTDSGVAEVESIQVPGVGVVVTSGLNYWYDSSYSYYEYKVGTGQLGDCGFITAGAQDPLKTYITARIKTTLGAVVVTATMTLFELNYAGSTVTDSDPVDLKPA